MYSYIHALHNYTKYIEPSILVYVLYFIGAMLMNLIILNFHLLIGNFLVTSRYLISLKGLLMFRNYDHSCVYRMKVLKTKWL